ncbi:circularly permuted type 2 ATP-grasp protein [Verrucomicrobium sp. GAS474]|uniref:circularly permuted type 2 ATP-grasp protein n=1 Tax=Verrucomicrobium sp. GAS474 TaxID=1882831 RepID=UPI000B8376EF|nr:circularly permuted type 2 ATP-grasp protein [Verrucomicrobium sp. GAS474]
MASLYDEFLQPDGSLRPHWREVGAYFDELGEGEITRRWNKARRILRDNGVAYNASMWDTQGPFRSWELNPIPLRIPQAEWSRIESAVRQRGRLLNAILEDAYSPNGGRLVADRMIPPALVLGNEAWLRPCVGVPVPKGARLVNYAVDLARSPDGTWWVLSDRTQAPSGAGYALENRVVSSRVFPEIFRSSQTKIARLSGYFRKMKEALEALSPRTGEMPTIVLMTPGRLNETYFEHDYLARNLDLTLVEGQDLTVRDDVVYIRTLQGLRRVDVIVRRVDDSYCDPLELRDDSLLGVPGLLNAVRAGTVALANSLGSGLVQCPALGAFLPKLSERLLGEKLLMPSVATWWCGQAAERQYVLNNLAALVCEPAFDTPGDFPSRAGSKAGGDGLDAIRKAIRQRPEMFTAQEFVRLSQCPDFAEGRLEPRSVILRVFAVRCGDDYAVMPGGLTRVADEDLSHGVLIRRGGGSKDTWVEFDEEGTRSAAGPAPGQSQGQGPSQSQSQSSGVRPESAKAASAQSNPALSSPRRATTGLTSRMADNLFWLGRYAERAEFTARIARTALEGLSDQQGWVDIDDLKPLVRTFLHFGQLPASTVECPSPEELRSVLISQMLSRENGGSLLNIVERLRDIITSVRDQVTDDAWRIASQLPDILPPVPVFSSDAARAKGQMEARLQSAPTSAPEGYGGEADLNLNQILLHLSALNGVLTENRTHDFGWRFIDLGRRIERSLYSSRIIAESFFSRGQIGENPERGEGGALFETLLDVFDAVIVYRGKYAVIHRDAVLELLLCDEGNPRSLVGQLSRMLDDLLGLPRDGEDAYRLPEERLVLRVLNDVRLIELKKVGPRALSAVESAMGELSGLLSRRFFIHLRTASVGRDVALDLPEAV